VLTVTPAAITVTVNPQSRSYGAANPVLTVSYSGFINGDTAAVISGTPVLSVGAITNSLVGTYIITNQLGTLQATNYGFVLVNGTLTVTPAPLTITANAATKVYGQTLAFGGGSTQFTASGLQNGETVGSVTLAVSNSGGAASAAVGGYSLTPSAATGGTFNPVNYTITYAPGVLTVTPAAIMVTVNPQSRSYGAVNPVLTVSYSGFINGDTAAMISGAPMLAVGAITNSPVGTYAITNQVGTLQATNYGFVLVNGTLTVTPAPLTITATAATKIYGQTMLFGNGSTQFTANGLQNSETIGSVTLAVSNNGGAATAPAGSYIITPSAATGGTFNPTNYIATYATGVLNVTGLPFGASLAAMPAKPVLATKLLLASPLVNISLPLVLGDGTVQLTFSGGIPGMGYEVQASTDLSRWTTLTNEVAGPAGLPAYRDIGATNSMLRFYRTVTP
jgi:hypothetical protein